MRSVYAKILAWSLATLLISMGLFTLINRQIETRRTGNLFSRFLKLELELARGAYETGGQREAADYIVRLDRVMGSHHYLLDSNGREFATGVDRSKLVTLLNGRWDQPIRTQEGAICGLRTPDSRYALIILTPVHVELWTLPPYYGLIFLTVAALCWPLAFHIGSPLGSLARIVDRFGQGDLSIRAHSARRDEIGDLARSFDRMADRIETLLTAERRLLQDVSHELRSPLARLSFAAELVRSQPDRDQAVARIRKEISRLSALVAALLEMTRAEGDPAAGQRTEFLLDELVNDLVEDCSLEAAARSCELEVESLTKVPISGDRELLRRAIENVLRNAIQYSPERAFVNVQLEISGGTARIGIRDRGPGVPEEQLSRIFDPFFRVDDSRTASTGGVGLGLAIATRAVRLHNGWIEAKNVSPGLLVTIGIPLTGIACSFDEMPASAMGALRPPVSSRQIPTPR